MSNAAERQRNFATIVYPESAPADWIDILNGHHVAALISPLHDKDTDPDGNQKKPHYHVMVMFDSPKNYERQVKPIFEQIGAVGREAVASMRGYARYLCHLDNPEKAQYEQSEVRALGGADYHSITSLPTDDIKMLSDIIEFVQQEQIYSFIELLDICRVSHQDWFAMIAMSRAYVIDKVLKSMEWEKTNKYVRSADREKVDPQTGEVI